MSTLRVFVSRLAIAALPLFLGSLPAAAGQQPDRNVAAATGCDLDAYERARGEFERLQTVKQFRPDQVSADELTAAANAYVALGERCYQALYANATQKIDDGGLILGPSGPELAQFNTNFGRKWGAGSPFAGGQDKPGPSIPGGTVTYSFMASGISIAAEGSDASLAITSLPAFQACFVTEIQSAFSAWSAIANIQFVQVADNGVAFNGAGASGDIRIAAHTFDGPSSVLAHAYFPPPHNVSAPGDMHFDRQENWSCSPGAGLIDIGIVTMHELGHSIGLDHEATAGRVALMNPFYSPSVAPGLLTDDILGARNIYGSAFGPSPSDDLLSDFGSFGLWQLFDGNTTTGWASIHDVSPKSVVTGDIDGNGIDEIIADFASLGIWFKLNNGGWVPLHVETANRMATGDLDGNGKDEVIIDFPLYGLWAWTNNLDWSLLHLGHPTNFVTGDMDGGGKKEVIADFAGVGVWVWRNNTAWSRLHTANSSLLTVGDFDANAKADVIVVFPEAGTPEAGTWNFSNNTSWSQVHTFIPTQVAAGDINGDGKSDFIADFGAGIGVWKLQSSSTGFTWAQISALVSTQLLVGDLNGNGKGEVIANFGANGLWFYADNEFLFPIHTVSPEALAVGDINAP